MKFVIIKIVALILGIDFSIYAYHAHNIIASLILSGLAGVCLGTFIALMVMEIEKGEK